MTVHELHRATDPETSRLAAEKIARKIDTVKKFVMLAFELCGPMTDEELSELDHFDDHGESTARGRRSELTRMGLIVDSGIKRNNRHGNLVIVWKLKPKGTLF